MKNRIIVTVSGGVVQRVAGIPENIEVEIQDYDCSQNLTTKDLKNFNIFKDSEDQWYESAVYDSSDNL